MREVICPLQETIQAHYRQIGRSWNRWNEFCGIRGRRIGAPNALIQRTRQREDIAFICEECHEAAQEIETADP